MKPKVGVNSIKKKKMYKLPISRIRDETSLQSLQTLKRIIKDMLLKLYANKFNNLTEMSKVP